jgi:hypothetical protein
MSDERRNGEIEDIAVWAARALVEIHRRDLPRITWTLAAARKPTRLAGQAIACEQVEAYADLLGVRAEIHDEGKRLTACGTFRGVPVEVTFYQRAEATK